MRQAATIHFAENRRPNSPRLGQERGAPLLKVVQITSARFHQFDLARQLEMRGLLTGMFTGYPHWKLRNEGLPRAKIHTFPWLQVPWMAGGSTALARIGCGDAFYTWSLRILDEHVARCLRNQEVDVLIAMSGHAALSGSQVKRAGGAWICVRGSTHILHQQSVMQAEWRRWGLAQGPIPTRLIAREEEEYARADKIAVPSQHVLRSFLALGVRTERLALVPYGVDLSRFYPVGEPPADEFRIIFAGALSLRKGLGHLLNAFAEFRHPRKTLLLVGSAVPETKTLLQNVPTGVRVLGHVQQAKLRELLSTSHVMVLSSVEEGMANVMGQALACGCPVVATEATGAGDLFSDGVEGYIVPEADGSMIAERLSRLADDPSLRQRMAEAGLRRVRELGGWDHYGNIMEALIWSLAGRRATG